MAKGATPRRTARHRGSRPRTSSGIAPRQTRTRPQNSGPLRRCIRRALPQTPHGCRVDVNQGAPPATRPIGPIPSRGARGAARSVTRCQGADPVTRCQGAARSRHAVPGCGRIPSRGARGAARSRHAVPGVRPDPVTRARGAARSRHAVPGVRPDPVTRCQGCGPIPSRGARGAARIPSRGALPEGVARAIEPFWRRISPRWCVPVPSGRAQREEIAREVCTPGRAATRRATA